MDLNKKSLIKIALFTVATSYFLYNFYQAIVTTIFVSHFSTVILQINKLIESSQPSLQLALFVFQELSDSVGVYLRLIAGFLALYSAILLNKKDEKYLGIFRKVLLLESLYFAFLIPASINHIVGAFISKSAFLSVYTGASYLLQGVLVFPSLFMLSRKLKRPQYSPSILRWASIAAPLYVFGLWVKHGFIWVYSPLGTQQASLIDTVGAANSLLTLLVAAIVTTAAWLTYRQKMKTNKWLLGTALILVGVYFVIYALVSVWVPIYLAFLPLTEFWMIVTPILGIVVLLDAE
jgi:hypothetical protein